MTKLTKKQITAPALISTMAALDIMEHAGGHAFLTPDGAHAIQDAFGIKRHLQTVYANTGEPKGLEVEGVPRNTPIKGYAVRDLAEMIADSLPCEHAYRMLMGRGSAARVAMAEIRKHLTGHGAGSAQ